MYEFKAKTLLEFWVRVKKLMNIREAKGTTDNIYEV